MCLSQAFRPEIPFTPLLWDIYHLKMAGEMMRFHRNFANPTIIYAKTGSEN